MKKEVKTRILGGIETLAFCGIYFAAAYVARFIMYLFFAVYYAISNYTNHEIFHADHFINDINTAISASHTELTFLADILMILLCALVIHVRGGKFKKYMSLQKTGWLQIFGALVAGAAIWYVSTVVISGQLANTQTLENYGKHMGRLAGSSPILAFILTVIVAPIAEEIMFRGALYNSVSRMLNKPMAILITSLLFAIVHGNPVQMAYAFVLGVMLCFIRSETEMLSTCIAMHFAFNLMNYFINGYIVPLWIAILVCCGGYALALYRKV